LLFPSLAAAAPWAGEVTSSALNVRARPGGTWLGTIQRGQRFVVDLEQGSWSRISWRGRSAWVSTRHLQRVAADAVHVDANALNVRRGPSTGYGVLAVAEYGQQYVRLAQQGGWVQVQLDQRTAWVAGWLTADESLPGPPAVSSGPVRGPATNPPMSATAAELEILARICKGEAGVASYEGKVAVVAVVLNRVRSSRFPNSIRRVAHQPWQFSCYNPDVRDRLYWGPIPQACWDAAREALRGRDPSLGATYYFNPYLVLPSWSRNMRFLLRIGTGPMDTHDFYAPR
jgi:N-acetylmuramoyl-L-alanine amidase